MTLKRSSGVLLHLTSLPGAYGIGDLGPSARAFVDFLEAAGQAWWQILPTVPVGEGWSPYKSPSAFAGNELLISPNDLVELGLLQRSELDAVRLPESDRVDYAAVAGRKRYMLGQAYEALYSGVSPTLNREFDAFCERQGAWLDDFALFSVLSDERPGIEWMDWEVGLVRRDPEILRESEVRYADALRRVQFEQFLFDRQWSALRAYARERGVAIMGDLPIYVAQHSADVWAHQHLFRLHAAGRPEVVAGVPPDYFSATGQYWGNPIYRWDAMESNGFAWWIQRLRRMLEILDLVRIDHFRGLEAYWEIPAEEKTAVNGRWVPGPGDRLLSALSRALGDLPVVAEDLGVITDSVTALMHRHGLPGMAVLQFALPGGEDDALLPGRLGPDRVAYTGTHDNDTFLGWWNELKNRAEVGDPAPGSFGSHVHGPDGNDSSEHAVSARRTLALAKRVLDLGDAAAGDVPWKALEALMRSDAACVFAPAQDLLALGREGRMNTPGVETGNWMWRLREGQLTPAVAGRLRELSEGTGRRARS